MNNIIKDAVNKWQGISPVQTKIVWFILVMTSTIVIMLSSMLMLDPRGVGASILIVIFVSFIWVAALEKKMNLYFKMLPWLLCTMFVAWLCGGIVSVILYYLINQVW
jgi:hypothetical protein